MITRIPKVAGMFYPAEKIELRSAINGLMGKVNIKMIDNSMKKMKKLCAVICPHAGYAFCGNTMAYSYKLLFEAINKSFNKKVLRVLILAPIHTFNQPGMCQLNADYYETPFGKVKAVKLPNLAKVEDDKNEHSIEVQLPFLQFIAEKTSKELEIIPVMVGPFGTGKLELYSDFLDRTYYDFIVVSSDLSHYLSYSEAVAKDEETIDSILDENSNPDKIDACGIFPIVLLKAIAKKKHWDAMLLNYSNSGMVAQKTNVVGYGSIAFFE